MLSLSAFGQRLWLFWFTICIAVVATQIQTLTLSPVVWQDEAQIVDYGRVCLGSGDQDWSVTWNVDGRPEVILNYMGCLLQDAACRLTNISLVGPRLASILGAVFAASMLLAWLVSRGLSKVLAIIMSTVLFLDPIFAQSYKGARVDCWAFGLIFAANSLMWTAASCNKWGMRSNFFSAFAGVAVALAGLFWASALLLTPLFLHEIFAAFRTRAEGVGRGVIIRNAGIAFAAGVITFAIGLAPIFDIVGEAISSLINGVGRVSQHKAPPVVLGAKLATIVENYQMSPCILLGGLLCLTARGNRALAAAAFSALIGVCLTSPYIHRSLYLLPYFILSVAVWTNCRIYSRDRTKLHYGFAFGLAGVLLLWASCMTLVARTWVALINRDVRDPGRIHAIAESALGEGAFKVYSDCDEFYYAGRRLGWLQYNFRNSNVRESEVLCDFISEMDFAILRSGNTNTFALQDCLERTGFRRCRTFTITGRCISQGAEFGDMNDQKDSEAIYWVYSKDKKGG